MVRLSWNFLRTFDYDEDLIADIWNQIWLTSQNCKLLFLWCLMSGMQWAKWRLSRFDYADAIYLLWYIPCVFVFPGSILAMGVQFSGASLCTCGCRRSRRASASARATMSQCVPGCGAKVSIPDTWRLDKYNRSRGVDGSPYASIRWRTNFSLSW